MFERSRSYTRYLVSGLLRPGALWLVCSAALVLSACGGSDDPPPVPPPGQSDIQFGVYDSIVVEGADDLEFVVSLSSASDETVRLSYSTSDGSALAGVDYTSANGSVEFAAGETRQFINIGVLRNPAVGDSSHSMQLVVSNPSNANQGDISATGTIIDRDTMSVDAQFDANWGQVGAFTNAAKCGVDCHKSSATIMQYEGEDISPNTQWQHSVMANAFNDPYWQAAVEDEADSFPALAGLIEDTCTNCHAPMGHSHAHHTGQNLDAENFYRFSTAVSDHGSREGVSCTLCHQVRADNLGTPASFSGGFEVTGDASDPDYKRIFGQYGSPVGNNMNMQTGHRPTQGTYISQSELCATCHTLYTATIHPETGQPTGDSFLEQGPFLEWQNSVYATGEAQEAQCQTCHMAEPAVNYSTKISQLPGTAPERSPYGQHALSGGNAHMLEILRQYRSELGIDASTTVAGFDRQIEVIRDFLDTAATLQLSMPVVNGGVLEFGIEVINNTGHKLPTSYPSRRAWLHVTVKDGADQVVFESGRPDARGYISTDEARLKADCMSAHKLESFDTNLCYEPHRNVIDQASQVAIFEAVIGDINDNITHTLLQGLRYLKDNRIPPAGFNNSRASGIEPQTVPAGVGTDNDFNCVGTVEGCGADTVHYRVGIDGRSGPFSVEARLLYQATQPAFVDGMHNTGDRVNRFKVMFDALPPSVEILATAMQSS